MDNNYPGGYTYPDSGNSSPRSREIDFDNSWVEEPTATTTLSTSSAGSLTNTNTANLKAKFMVSYGGKIQPRPHDNQLSYVGGETKILAVDRTVRFTSLIAKLSSLFPEAGACGEVSFKYQLPGEDLDALISVTNDDDLDHLMHEYDRLNRVSSKPARLRLFLFSANAQPPPVLHHSGRGDLSNNPSQFGSTDSVKSDRARMFVDALNSAAPPPVAVPVPVPAPIPATIPAAVTSNNNNVDFLFGLEKGIGVGVVPAAQQMHHPVSPPPPQTPPHITKQQLLDPIPDPDYGIPDPQIEARIQELNRLQISANQQQQQQLHQQLQQQQMHLHQQEVQRQQQVHHQLQQQIMYQAAAKSEENSLVDPGYGLRSSYPPQQQHHHHHLHQQQQQTYQPAAGYWAAPAEQQKNINMGGGVPSSGGGGFQGVEQQQQPVYMIPATGAVYHHHHTTTQQGAAAAAVMRSAPQGMSVPPPQVQQQTGYYQRVQTGEVYRDMPVYGVVSTAQPQTVPATISSQVMRQQQQQVAQAGGDMGSGGGGGYAQVAYDSATGRQVYYAAPPGVGSGGSSGGSVPVGTPYQVSAVGGGGGGSGPVPAAVVSNSTVVNGGGGGEGRTSGGGESVGKAVAKVSSNSATV